MTDLLHLLLCWQSAKCDMQKKEIILQYYCVKEKY